jgi:hypothetical protein
MYSSTLNLAFIFPLSLFFVIHFASSFFFCFTQMAVAATFSPSGEGGCTGTIPQESATRKETLLYICVYLPAYAVAFSTTKID